MDLGDYTMVKERGMRNDEGGMKIAQGIDTGNMDLGMGPTLAPFTAHYVGWVNWKFHDISIDFQQRFYRWKQRHLTMRRPL